MSVKLLEADMNWLKFNNIILQLMWRYFWMLRINIEGEKHSPQDIGAKHHGASLGFICKPMNNLNSSNIVEKDISTILVTLPLGVFCAYSKSTMQTITWYVVILHREWGNSASDTFPFVTSLLNQLIIDNKLQHTPMVAVCITFTGSKTIKVKSVDLLNTPGYRQNTERGPGFMGSYQYT